MSQLTQISQDYKVAEADADNFAVLVQEGNPDFVLLHHEGFLSDEKFIAVSRQGLEKLNSSASKSVVVDIENLKVLSKGIQSFIQEEWFPKASGYGLKKLAFVKPKDIFGMASMNAANTKAQGLEMEYFDDLEKAIAWAKQ